MSGLQPAGLNPAEDDTMDLYADWCALYRFVNGSDITDDDPALLWRTVDGAAVVRAAPPADEDERE